MKSVVKIGEMFFADLSPVIGSEQGGIRPVVVISNDIANRYSQAITIAPITSQINKAKLPVHVELSMENYDIARDSVVLLEQIRTIDKKRLKEKIGTLIPDDLLKVKQALATQVDLRYKEVDEAKPVDNTSKNIENQISKIVDILQSISHEYGLDKVLNKELQYKEYYSTVKEDLKGFDIKLEKIHENVKVHKAIRDISKGQLGEFAVVEYFKYHGYNAERAGDELDSLKIDVIAQDEERKIYIQVKTGQIAKEDLWKLVNNVKDIEDNSGLAKVIGIVAEKFQANSEFSRLRLQEKFNIPIILIHKYQILEIVSEFDRTIN